MEKKCSGCGSKIFAEPGDTKTCPYCGLSVSFEKPSTGETQIINNITISTTGNATPMYVVNAPPMPRQRVGVHFWLFLFTGGLGNIIYGLYVYNAKKQWLNKWGPK